MINTPRLNRRNRVRVAAMALVVAGVVAILASPARAAVSLVLSDNDATPTAVSVVRGQSFNVTVSVTSSSEKLTGVDYYLQVAGAAIGKLRLTARDMSASQFNDPVKLNTGDNGANAGVLDASVSLLNPKNTLDLGASIANVSSALNAGTYALATYTILVDATTAAGTYTLSTSSLAGSGWVGAAPLFADGTFTNQGSFSVTVTTGVGTVVPEPGSAALILGALFPLALRRRR